MHPLVTICAVVGAIVLVSAALLLAAGLWITVVAAVQQARLERSGWPSADDGPWAGAVEPTADRAADRAADRMRPHLVLVRGSLGYRTTSHDSGEAA